MAAPMVDLHVKSVVEYTFEVILSDPDKYLKEIFGDFKLDPHTALYGDMIEKVKKWMTSTQIPVVLGYDVNPAEFPAVTVHLSQSAPGQPFLGDLGGFETETLMSQQRDVLVAAFAPFRAEWSDDKTYLIIEPPTEMPLDQQELILPGLYFRDSKGHEYAISRDDDGNILMLASDSGPKLTEADLSRLEVVSPIIAASFNQGAMIYEEQVTLAIHGHSNRNEGLWLYYIVMWGLLKFRPILATTFGLHLSFPAGSDYLKDMDFLGTEVWRRFITIQAKTVWTWQASRQQDILGLILTVQNGRSTPDKSGS